MAKDVLTQERFLWDYKNKIRSTIKPVIGLLIFLLCVLVLLLFLSIRVGDCRFDLDTIWPLLILVVWICFCVAALILSYKDYQSIKQGSFHVVTDELIGKSEQETYHARYLRAFSKTAKLKFHAYGTYFPNLSYDSDSSDRYAVSDTDNYFSSSVGDTFLLVINKKSHILLVYNTKLFEFHG